MSSMHPDSVAAPLEPISDEEVVARVVKGERQVEGLSTEETAACLGVTSDVAKTRLSRARVMLRKKLIERADLTFDRLFEFHAPRCDGVVSAVMQRIGG